MPGSEGEGKALIGQWVTVIRPHSIIDVGPGMGTYRHLLDPVTPKAHWTGIEVWKPYVEQYDLDGLYDDVIVDNALTVDLDLLKLNNELAIFGDVVEHFPKEQGIEMVQRLPWRWAIISLPIIEYPQGEYEGNPHEAHLHTWDHQQVLRAFPEIVAHNQAERIGAYLLIR